MFAEGIFPIGDGLLDIDEERLKDLLVPHDINEIYEVEQTPFARGKFAAVRRAIHKNSGTHFAAKFLKRRRRAQSSDKEIKHEIAVLMLCNEADNIVKLNAVHESRSDTALLLELATGGELQTFLDNEECLSEAQARICMRQVLKALQFLHKRSIVHLDLKPQNILLAGERIEDGLKLCDFGISRVVAEGTNIREIVGTPDYVAPEVLQYEPLSLLTDIWSVGVLAYVLLSGFSPFGGETKQETFLNISQCALTFPDKLFGGVSSAAIDFMRKALRIKPNDRMTAAGCLEHIWLKDECNIDRHIFNAITNKQQLEHDDDDDDDDDDEEDDVDVDVDDDEEDDADVDVDDEDHVVDVNVANDVEAEAVDQQNEEVNETTTNTIADDDDDDEVQIIKDKLPQAISVDNSEEEDNNTSNTSFTKTVNKPFSKSINTTTTINNTTTTHHQDQYHRSSSNGGLTNGHSKSHSNNSLTNGHHTNGLANGHHHDYTTNGYANGHLSAVATKGSGHRMYNSYTKLREELNDKSAKLSLVRPSMSTTTTKTTTAVHNVTATKAITIPLCSVQPQLHMQQHTLTTTPHEQQQQQQQQLLHIPARRHSSESNKENTFLTTKKITANNISNGSSSSSSSSSSQATLKKTSTLNNSTNSNSSSSFSSSPSSASLSTIPNHTQSATATATIHITPNPTLNSNSNIVATITLPTAASVSVINGVNISSDKTVANTATNTATTNNHHSLFPDAPTTPKVIRKAPTTDASPTSVKALVKKFQLEGGDQTITPPEFATNGSKHNHHQQHQHQHQHQHQLLNQSQTKYNNVRSTLSPPTLAHSSAITIMNSSRRASEPITAIHMNNNNNNNNNNNHNNNSNKKVTSTSAPVSIPASAANNFKTTCVYCVSCTNSLTNGGGGGSGSGCRHPNSLTNNISTSLASTTTATAATKYSSSNHCSNSSSTKSLNNAVGNATFSNNTAGGGNNSTTTTTTTTANSSSSNGSSSSQALLFGQHTQQHLMNSSHQQQQQQQQQHLNHHHHHHHHHTHHHLHHHGVVVKNANASANGLSLDQGIIC